MVEGGKYDQIMLCNHSNESYNLPQIENFSGVNLSQKSMLLFFAGTEDLSTLLEKD